MTIKISNNTARLLLCAIVEYNTSLTDRWLKEEDQEIKDRTEECIFELEALYRQIDDKMEVNK